MHKKELLIPVAVIAFLAFLGLISIAILVFGDRWRLRAKRLGAISALAAAVGLSWGCTSAEEDETPGGDAGLDAATDTDADTDVDSDSDSDTDVDSDSDAGTDPDAGCSGVTCYESVPVVRHDISIQGVPRRGVVDVPSGAGRVLELLSRASYARDVSFRVEAASGDELAAGDAVRAGDVAASARFLVAVPPGLSAGRHVLRLYGTSLANVRTYATFPSVSVPLEVGDADADADIG